MIVRANAGGRPRPSSLSVGQPRYSAGVEAPEWLARRDCRSLRRRRRRSRRASDSAPGRLFPIVKGLVLAGDPHQSCNGMLARPVRSRWSPASVIHLPAAAVAGIWGIPQRAERRRGGARRERRRADGHGCGELTRSRPRWRSGARDPDRAAARRARRARPAARAAGLAAAARAAAAPAAAGDQRASRSEAESLVRAIHELRLRRSRSDGPAVDTMLHARSRGASRRRMGPCASGSARSKGSQVRPQRGCRFAASPLPALGRSASLGAWLAFPTRVARRAACSEPQAREPAAAKRRTCEPFSDSARPGLRI